MASIPAGPGYVGITGIADPEADHLIRVVLISPGSSAQREGVRIGDLLLTINGHKADNEHWVKLLAGHVGDRRTLTIQRQTGDSITRTLELLKVPSNEAAQRHRAFLAIPKQIDRSVTCTRIANSPYRFVGRVVEIKGVVAEPEPGSFNIACNDGGDSNKSISVQWYKSQEFEQAADADVIGVVFSPVYGETEKGGESTGTKATFSMLDAYYVNGKSQPGW